MDFAEKYGPWAVIAGASEGTGRSFAHKLAQRGLNLVLVARRQGPLDALAAELNAAYPVECVTASIDLAAEDAARQLAAAAGDREVGLFIMNAGADPNAMPFLDLELDDWDTLVARNVVTTMRSTYQFVRPMKERGRGGIILVGSGACYGGLVGNGVYCGTKAFDLCMGEALWGEMRPHGVDVLNLILGRTDTPAHRETLAKKGIPFPDGTASPDDVAETGLARLPHGPVHNYGLADDEVGMMISSAADRRNRILMIENATKGYRGKD